VPEVDASLTAVFAADGPLAQRIPGFQSRPQQLEMAQAVLEAIDDIGLEVVVLHEDADAELCSDLSSEVEVVKAFRIDGLGEKEIAALIAPFDDVCDYYLFVSEQNDWSALGKVKVEKPFFISGNISAAAIAGLKAFRHPDLYGVGVSLDKMASDAASAMAGVLQLKKLLGA
jgi:phosphoribosylanthranilate isomerase